MKITRILIFLSCLAFVPFVMGPKGCGGVIPMGALDKAVDVDVVETGSELEFAGEQPPVGEPPPEGEPGAAGEGPPEVGGGLVKAFGEEQGLVCEAAKPEEGKPGRQCPTCNQYLPPNADVVVAVSFEKLLGSRLLTMFSGGQLRELILIVASQLNIDSIVNDPTQDIKRACAACLFPESPTEEGVGQESGVGDHLYRTAPQLSIMGLIVSDTVIPDQERTMTPDLSGGLSSVCREWVLIIEMNLKEGASLENYIGGLDVGYTKALSVAAESVVLATPLMLFSDAQTTQFEGLVLRQEAPTLGEQPIEGEEGLILRQPTEEGLILRQPTEEGLILRQPEPSSEKLILDRAREGVVLDAAREGLIFQQPGSGDPSLFQARSATPEGGEEGSYGLAMFTDVEGQDRWVGVRVVDGMLVIGTQNYLNAVAAAVAANDQCPHKDLWLSLSEGMLKMAGPTLILGIQPTALYSGAWMNELLVDKGISSKAVVVYDAGEQRFFTAAKIYSETNELMFDILLRSNLGSFDPEKAVNFRGTQEVLQLR